MSEAKASKARRRLTYAAARERRKAISPIMNYSLACTPVKERKKLRLREATALTPGQKSDRRCPFGWPVRRSAAPLRSFTPHCCFSPSRAPAPETPPRAGKAPKLRNPCGDGDTTSLFPGISGVVLPLPLSPILHRKGCLNPQSSRICLNSSSISSIAIRSRRMFSCSSTSSLDDLATMSTYLE